jgi:hypothetical protein
MSNTITRGQFVRELGSDGGALNINDLPPDLKKRLLDAGVDAGDLERIAGRDAQIRGTREMAALFDLLDQVDSDRSSQSFAHKQSADPGAQPTLAGAAYDKLKEEVASRRLAAQSQGIVHLGMRPASDKEVRALRAETPAASGGVHAIRAYASDGKIDYNGRSFDLGTDAGREAFRDALVSGPDKVPSGRAQALIDKLGSVDVKTRDELAQLGLALHRIGKGDLAANRLVISGHGSGRSVLGDGTGSIKHDTIREIARLFPEGAGKIQHLAMSSCFSAKSSELDQFRRDFPSLKTFWGYNGTSPLAETSAPAHLRTWANRSDGDDPSAMDPRGSNAATWNPVEGEQNFSSVSWLDAERALRASESVWPAYQNGSRHLAAGERDPQLDLYYRDLQNALSSPDLPAASRPALEQRRDEVLRARHPELFP